jgi:asparagine synthase (glutamine-hydrolysing)
MNIFLIAWNAPCEEIPRLLASLKQLIHVYPQLDITTLKSIGGAGQPFAAVLHSAEKFILPRKYVKQTKNTMTFYDGCVVGHENSLDAHDAAVLSRNWKTLPEMLEGQFVVAAVSTNPPRVELLIDPLGVYQTYYTRHGDTYLVSNSVHLLEQITGIREIDPLGVSLYLMFGWAGNNRTLRSGIKVIPGGQYWRWLGNDVEPKRDIYFRRTALLRRGHRKLYKSDVINLAERLTQYCNNLARNFGPLECPITAGRDSRLMLALLLRGGTAAQYFSSGRTDSADVQIGSEIAKRFGLTHDVKGSDSEILLRDWEDLSARLVRRTDGMGSLAHISTVRQEEIKEEHLTVHLYGCGGEIARGYYTSPYFLLRAPTSNVDYVQSYLFRKLTGTRTRLLCADTATLADTYLRQFAEEALDEGFSFADLPDVFYAYERTRRWAGIQYRQVLLVKDVFSPFCTRPFLEASFSIPALRRYSNHVHYELLRFLAKDLHQMRFEKKWPPQSPVALFASAFISRVKNKIEKSLWPRRPPRVSARRTERSSLMESKREDLRSLCLDQPNSSLWNYVDRRKFSEMMSKDDPIDRMRHQQVLFDIATIFLYASHDT